MKTLERDQFEAYFADSRRNRGAKKRPNFDTLSDGTYADDHTQRHWWTWQQARAACRAEALEEAAQTTEAEFVGESLDDDTLCAGDVAYNMALKHASAAIREMK